VEQITRAGAAGKAVHQARIVRVGADLAKRVIQVHAVDAAGRVVCRRALRREAFVAWCTRLPAGCIVAMEISSGAHHWARALRGLGLEPRLMSAQLVAPYRSQADALEDGSHEMNTLARLVIQRAAAQWAQLDAHLAWCDERIAAHARDNAQVRAAAQLMGIGPVGASAVVATVDDFAQFKSGAQFCAWCGLVPRQHSSGGKTQLGPITRRGDSYLRSLPIQGAKSVVFSAHKRSDSISRWLVALRERSSRSSTMKSNSA
jgi:transposase